MVDDHGRGQPGEEVPQQRQLACLEVDDDVPAERLDAPGDLCQLVPGCEVDQALEEVETDAADTGVVQRLQLAIGDVAPDGGDATRFAGAAPDRIDHRAVIGAVTGGLHDHVAAEAEMVAQRE